MNSDVEYKPYCDGNCWAATSLIGVLLSLALTPGEQGSKAAICRLRGNAAEKALEIMGLVNLFRRRMNHAVFLICLNPF